jgi:hypothetical protein
LAGTPADNVIAASSSTKAAEMPAANGVVKKDYIAKVAFLMDVTGSMDTECNAVKSKILDIVDEMYREFPGVAISLAFYGYRDVGERPVIVPFTTDSVYFQKEVIDGVTCSGGGDEAEDVLGGLDSALTSLDWSNANVRLLFHVADSPHHGRQFHDSMGCDDSHPELENSPRPYEAILAEYADKKIDYCFALVKSHGRNVVTTRKMAMMFQDAYNKAQTARNPMTICDLSEFSPQAFFAKVTAALSATMCSFLRKRK